MHATETSGKPPQTEPALRAIAMPADANPHGDIFGGWLLSQMDLAGGSAALRRAAVSDLAGETTLFLSEENPGDHRLGVDTDRSRLIVPACTSRPS